MKYAAAFAMISALATCQCSPFRSHPVVVHEAPRVTHVFHGDVEFTPAQRAIVAKAISALEYQTAGMYRLSVIYDLNYNDINSLTALRDEALIVYMQSDYQVIQYLDNEKGAHILGLTLQNGMTGEGKNPQVYLVVDRLEDPARFQHVVMHELLHAAGLDDLGPPGSVMSGATCHYAGDLRLCENVVCMTPSDAAEFCRVNRCQVGELNGCAW